MTLLKPIRNSKVEVSKIVAAPGSFWQQHWEASHKPFTFWKVTIWKHRPPIIICKSLAFHFKRNLFWGIFCKTFLGSDDGVPGGLDCALLVRESFSLVLSLQEARDKRQDFEKVVISSFQTFHGLRDEGWKVGWWCLMGNLQLLRCFSWSALNLPRWGFLHSKGLRDFNLDEYIC